MTPIIAIVGRPNVGKSTLFNCLTRRRDAIVSDQPGLTRDRHYGAADLEGRPVLLVDTGGIGEEEGGIDAVMSGQTRTAMSEASLVLFVVDARSGLTPVDEQIAAELRRAGVPLLLVLNKTDGLDASVSALEFYDVGMGDPVPVSAAHGRGVRTLAARCAELMPAPGDAAEEEDVGAIRVAVVGRPNVGKSTLINCLLGEERVIVYDEPGTTRDSISVPFRRGKQEYRLIDTAGVRRKGRVQEHVEKISVLKTLQSIQEAHVVILVMDASQGIADQDLHLLGQVLDAGRGLVIATNKWDAVEREDRERILAELDRRLHFIGWARVHRISAREGHGVSAMMRSVHQAWRNAGAEWETSRLTRLLEDLIAAHAPPAVQGRRIKLRFAHQGGSYPPKIVIHGNQTDHVPDSYRRYLENGFRKQLSLQGTVLRIEFKTGENPFAGRRNKLTPRQERSRKRMLRHVKKK